MNNTLSPGMSGGLAGMESGDGALGSIDWNAIINQGFAVGSHAISAFSGQNSGTQVGYNGEQGGIFAITPSANYGTPYGQQQGVLYPANNLNPINRSGVAEDAFSSVGNFVSQHPLWVFGGIAAVFLLMREPPKRR